MSNDWEKALHQAMDEIAAGAAPLSVEPETRDRMWNCYKPDFSVAYDPVDWQKSGPRILALAQTVGQWAAILTHAQTATAPVAVDTEAAHLAGYLVSKLECPARGRHCQNFPPPASAQAFESLLLENLRNTLDLVVRETSGA